MNFKNLGTKISLFRMRKEITQIASLTVLEIVNHSSDLNHLSL